jgi:hypothetical protein
MQEVEAVEVARVRTNACCDMHIRSRGIIHNMAGELVRP